MLLTVSIICIIVSTVLTIFSIYKLKHIQFVNTEVAEKNKQLEDQRKNLEEDTSRLMSVLEDQQRLKDTYTEQLNTLQSNITNTLDNKEELSRRAFENYCEILEKDYEDKEKEYDMYEQNLHTAYENLQTNLLKDIDKVREELTKLEATRAAAIQAKLKEKEIKEQQSFYCLKITDNELADIKTLERIKPQLNQPRILSMLIWKTYYQKPMTNLCNNVIGLNTKCGIYKITNQLDDMCYIGQSVDIATRWKDHAKCGLGIDTPPNNKLYQSMIEDGLWNFSFEVLEECPREKLDEKEKYYIQLYQSKDYGYNSTIGNK